MLKNLLLSFAFILSFNLAAQVGIGTATPNSSSILELNSSSKGLLIPRVSLTGTLDATTIINGNVESLIVYNATAVSGLVVGFYFWSGTKWESILDSDRIVDNLDDGGSNMLLSAEQGRVLKSLYDNVSALTEGKVYIGDAENVAVEQTISGDITLALDGVSTIGVGKVDSSKIVDGTIEAIDLATDAVEEDKIKDANVTNAKLDKGNIPLTGFGATTSDELAAVISDETGTGEFVLSVSPTFTGAPVLPIATIAVTQVATDSSTQLATTEYTTNAVKSFVSSISTKTASYTTDLFDSTILVEPSADSNDVTITLLSAVPSGKKYIVKKANSNNGVVNVVAQTGTIEGQASLSTDVAYQGWVLQYDGANWHIINQI